MSSNIPKRKSEGKGHQRWKTPRVCKGQWKVQNNYFKKSGGFIYSGAINIKYNKFFPCLLTLQTSADAIVRFTNIKQDGEIESHGKLLEREFMVHDKCYRVYTHLPKGEIVRYLKFLIKNVNTTYYFFTISAYKNFLKFF